MNNTAQQQAIGKAHEAIVLGALMYPALGKKARKQVDEDVAMFMSIGIQLPTAEEFCAYAENLGKFGIPSCGYSKKDTAVVEGLYKSVYAEISTEWNNQVIQYRLSQSQI